MVFFPLIGESYGVLTSNEGEVICEIDGLGARGHADWGAGAAVLVCW